MIVAHFYVVKGVVLILYLYVYSNTLRKHVLRKHTLRKLAHNTLYESTLRKLARIKMTHS